MNTPNLDRRYWTPTIPPIDFTSPEVIRLISHGFPIRYISEYNPKITWITRFILPIRGAGWP